MITLITGTPGSGKTLYAVTKILEYVEQNKKLLAEGKEPRVIYSDIDGLNVDGVEPAPEDWRDTPDGSVIFYDEIQQREFFKKSRFDNDVCDALQIHRHTGHDIFGITQFPVLLHPNFRAVVGMHYHLHRGWGLSSATVFSWAYCVDAPNAPSNKKLAEHTFRFNYDKSVYKYYKSATVHTHKRRIPKNIFLILVVVLAVGYYAINALFFKDNFFRTLYAPKLNSVQPATKDDTVSLGVSSANTQTPSQEPVSAPEVSHETIIQERKQELHKKYLSEYTVEVADDPVVLPASVIAMGGKCEAYNQYGDRLNIPNKQCLDMLSDYGKIPKRRDGYSQTSSNVDKIDDKT